MRVGATLFLSPACLSAALILANDHKTFERVHAKLSTLQLRPTWPDIRAQFGLVFLKEVVTSNTLGDPIETPRKEAKQERNCLRLRRDDMNLMSIYAIN